MIPGNWIPGPGEPKPVSAKLIRHSGFWIRWGVDEGQREVVMEESRFYEEAKREEWTPKRPREITFRRIGDTNEFFEV